MSRQKENKLEFILCGHRDHRSCIDLLVVVRSDPFGPVPRSARSYRKRFTMQHAQAQAFGQAQHLPQADAVGDEAGGVAVEQLQAKMAALQA